MNTILKQEYKKNFNNPKIEIIINLILVFHDVRDAFLFETANYPNVSDYVIKLATDLNLFILEDPIALKEYPRLLISKSQINQIIDDSHLGQLLGFICYDHNYSNQNVKRVIINVLEEHNNVSITTEVCEFDKINLGQAAKIYNDHIEKWDKVLQMYDLKCNFILIVNIEIPKSERIQMVINNDIDYVLNHLYSYYNDLENDYTVKCQLADSFKNKDVDFISNNFDLFKMIYLTYSTVDQPKYIKEYRKNQEKIENLLCKFETELSQLLNRYKDIMP